MSEYIGDIYDSGVDDSDSASQRLICASNSCVVASCPLAICTFNHCSVDICLIEMCPFDGCNPDFGIIV